MGMTEKIVINIDDVPLADRGNGKQFAVKWGRVGPLVGLHGLGCAVHVVPPGKKAFPFHRHHVQDELFFVVSGEGEYRFGEKIVRFAVATSLPRRPARKRTNSSILAPTICVT
jgi:uncharacterized cupin superfamily protein